MTVTPGPEQHTLQPRLPVPTDYAEPQFLETLPQQPNTVFDASGRPLIEELDPHVYEWINSIKEGNHQLATTEAQPIKRSRVGSAIATIVKPVRNLLRRNEKAEQQRLDRQSLIDLQQEMGNPNRSEVIGKAYDITRRILTDELSDAIPGHEAEMYVWLSDLWQKNPIKAFVEVEGRSANFGIDRTLEATREEVGRERAVFANRLYEAMRADGMNNNHTIDIDANLFATLRQIAHEGSHGLDQAAGSAQGGSSATYLARHPEKAISSDKNTALAIHIERFGEGGARVVLDRALRALDYTKRERGVVIAALSHTAEDVKSVEAEGAHGASGYTLPLTRIEMATQLLESTSTKS